MRTWLLALMAVTIDAQPPTQDELLQRLARAYGVDDAAGAEHVVFHGIGVEHRSAEVQGHGPARQSVARNEVWWAIAPAARTTLFEYRIGRHDGSERWRRRVIRGDTAMIWDFHDTFYSANRSASADLARRRLARSLPHALVHEASRLTSGVSSLADERFGGRVVSVRRVTFDGERTPIDLLVHEPTLELVAMRYALEFPGIGPTVARQEFLDQRRDAALGWIPTRIITRLDTAVYREVGIVRAERSRALMDSIIGSGSAPSAHAGMMPAAAPTAAAPTSSMGAMPRPMRDTLIQVAPGAHVLRAIGGRYNMFVVEQSDGLFVAEAPAVHPTLDEWPTNPVANVTQLSRDAVAIIQRRFPGVPIRRVMPTHFHSDHAAGVGAFVDAGARIVATRGDSAYFAALLARDGSASAASRRVAFDIVTDSLRLRSAGGAGEIVLHTVRHGVHAIDNTFVWLPARGVLFQGDLFYVDDDGTQPPSRMGVMREFVGFLDRRGIAPAIMWGMHGNLPARPEHLARVRAGR